MYSDPARARRAAINRLGSRFTRPSPPPPPPRDRVGWRFTRLSPRAPPFLDRRHGTRSRRSPDITNHNGAFNGEMAREARNYLPCNLGATDREKYVPRCTQSDLVSAREGQITDFTNAQSPRVLSTIVKSGRQFTSTKETVPPTSGERKYILVTMETFLERLGLSKYLLAFQAEEIDMFALKHMNDNDLKDIGLPMGPRKKIISALARLKSKK